MNKPVYVFSGFLDSGKTQAIKETLYDQRFNQGEKSLIICFEQGDVIYDDKFLKITNSEVVYLNSINELTHDKQKELDKKYKPERVVIELNGMEDDNLLYKTIGFYPKWELAQTLTTVDASTFTLYMNNMRQFMYNHIVNAEVCILNRSDNVDKRFLRNNLKSINQRLELIYEDANGNISSQADEDLFDLSKDLFIEDIDYGLWYMDALDNPDKYNKKNITIKVKFVEEVKEYSNLLIMGRKAMVCCANDVTDIAISCINISKKDIDENQYYYLSGTLRSVRASDNSKVVVLYVKEFKVAPAPESELVTFN